MVQSGMNVSFVELSEGDVKGACVLGGSHYPLDGP